jgi:alkanesulfonate monooxygenase SsuD/methylene tetrahydromethanopterin reductase-like flavin-dependent oxidoreductase (luciferase family)
VELADRLGIDFAWEVGHHFLEEYSHSSATEVFLAACSQRTKRMRLDHGIVLMPPSMHAAVALYLKVSAFEVELRLAS